jgi:hypothetical protein
MATVCFSETLVSTYESTRRHNPQEQHRRVKICFVIYRVAFKKYLNLKCLHSFIKFPHLLDCVTNDK